ncbi:MAG: hypothetical protein ACP5F6_07930 [Microbacter sp.]
MAFCLYINRLFTYEINRLEFNPEVLPEVIYNSFISLMEKEPNKIDFAHFYPFSLQKESIEGDQIYTYYLFINDWNLFINKIRNKELRDENDELIGLRASESYLLSYAKGFSKGYSEFEPSINHNELFNRDNTDLAYQVFASVWGKNINKGSINEGETMKIKDYENFDSFFYYIDADLMFQQGIKGGKFYKAWEIILSNPLKFENFFSDYLKTNKPKPTFESYLTPLDDSDKTKLMATLHKQLNERSKGKLVAQVINALSLLGYILIPAGENTLCYEAMKKVFGFDTSDQSINYYRKDDDKDKNTLLMKNTLQIN